MKKIGFVLALVLTLAMLTAMTGPAFAETSGAGFAEGSAAGSYDGSLFTAGGSVDSSAQVKGVQFAAGSDVQVQGSCEYLMAAGNQLVFSGGAETMPLPRAITCTYSAASGVTFSPRAAPLR